MTDPDLTTDELVSAYLDGAATPEESARVEADPALRARVQELAAARDRLRAATVTVDPSMRDRMIERALQDAPPDQGAVVALARRRGPRAPHLVAAAAVLLAVGLLGGVVAMLQGEGDDDMNVAGAPDAAAADADEGPRVMQTPEAAEDAPGAPADDVASVTHLGRFASLEVLQARLADSSAPDPEVVTGDDARPPPPLAPAEVHDCVAPGDELLHTAEVAGRPVLVLGGPEALDIVDAVTCERLGHVVP